MLLAVDIGNSSIKFGVFDRDQLTTKFFVTTRRDYLPAEIAEHVGDRLFGPFDAVIISSVVPEIDAAMAAYISSNLRIEPRFVTTTDDFGLKFRFPIDTIGTDRLVNSFAAVEKYGAPCIVVSLGTATTIDVINQDREYLGGLIAPGMIVTAKALALTASKLPEIEISKPECIIADTTKTAIQSGIVYGHIAMVEGLSKRVKAELSEPSAVAEGLTPRKNNAANIKGVATGGFADFIAKETDLIDIVDNDLTIDGLRMLFQRSSR